MPKQRIESVRLGDIDRVARNQRVQRRYRRHIVRIAVVACLLICLLVSAIAVYNSSLFTVEEVTVSGVEHLTATEMTELAAVPANTTLLRVDTAAIEARLESNAWVKEATVTRVFPHTINLEITERVIAAVVEVPVDSAGTIERWAIAEDGVWLMAIPEEGSEESRSISSQIYTDAAAAFTITGASLGVNPVVGETCSDEVVNNALAIATGLTTELADQIAELSAEETTSTTLILESGVEVVFGEAGTTEEIRTKERVVLALLEEYGDSIVYINVRVPDSPTWRSL